MWGRGMVAAARGSQLRSGVLSPAQTRLPAVLADLPPGARARVLGVLPECPAPTMRRLQDLGFTAGTVVDVVRKAPLADPVEYRVKDYNLCLRRAQAACIGVVVLSTASEDVPDGAGRPAGQVLR